MSSHPRPAPIVSLVPMSRATYDAWLARVVREYADEHVEAGNWLPGEALEKAQQQFDQLLPDGLHTAGQHLFSICELDGTEVGILWVGPRPGVPRALFIWDIQVHEQARGHGFGGATLTALHAWAREQGFERVGLHVFGSNDVARRLYARAGYVETDVQMEKRL